MKNYRYILSAFLVTTFSFMYLSAHGQDGFVCSYESVLRLGLEKNFDIKLSELDLKSMRGQTVTAIGLTNPYMGLDFKSNAGTEPTLTYGDYKTLDASFVLPTRYGVDYSTGFTLGRINNVEYPSPDIPMNEAGAWASVSVSLLRGLGRYNSINSSILASREYYRAKQEALSDEVTRYVRDVTIAYVKLRKDVNIYKSRLEDLHEAEQYLKLIEEMIAYNEIPASEINRAKAFSLGYQQKKSDAENEVMNSLNALYELVGEKSNAGINEIPTCTDSLFRPEHLPNREKVDSILAIADTLIKQTPYYRALSSATSGAEIDMKGAANQKRHQLDLTLRYYYYGDSYYAERGDYSNVFKGTSTYPGPSFYVALSYKLPFQNQIYKGQYITKLANYEAQSTQAEKIKFDAENSVRTLLNNMHNLENLYKFTRQYATVQRLTYNDEKKKFRLGSSNQLDIISAYETFADARVSTLDMAYNLYNTMLQLKYLIGDLPKTQAELEKTDLEKISVLHISGHE